MKILQALFLVTVFVAVGALLHPRPSEAKKTTLPPPPRVTLPADLEFTADADADGAVVSYDAHVVARSKYKLVCNIVSGKYVLIGEYTLTCTAKYTDAKYKKVPAGRASVDLYVDADDSATDDGDDDTGDFVDDGDLS